MEGLNRQFLSRMEKKQLRFLGFLALRLVSIAARFNQSSLIAREPG
jgi:hypothetical protein